jgi:hypothetical protein
MSFPAQLPVMTRHVLIAESTKGLERQYIASSKSGALSDDISNVALFVTEGAAETAARELLTRDFERKNKVTLLLATVEISVTSSREIARKRVARGYVIRRNTGKYYKGPKTRLPRDFRDAYYNYVDNPDAATVFPTKELAVTTGEACRAILLKTAEQEEQRRPQSGATYRRSYTEFGFSVETV